MSKTSSLAGALAVESGMAMGSKEAKQEGTNVDVMVLRADEADYLKQSDEILVPKGECISCATLHYFITVVAQKGKTSSFPFFK